MAAIVLNRKFALLKKLKVWIQCPLHRQTAKYHFHFQTFKYFIISKKKMTNKTIVVAGGTGNLINLSIQ